MPTSTFTAGTPCWIDLASPEPERSVSFYHDLFGWHVVDAGEQAGHYQLAHKGEAPVGGIGSLRSPETPTGWTVFFGVTSAADHLVTAQAHGASLAFPIMDVPDLGRMATLIAPDGSGYGIWQPASFSGFGVDSEPGAPGWFDLQTRDFPTATAYYRAVMGVDPIAMPPGATDEMPAESAAAFSYQAYGTGSEARFGIWGAADVLPAGVPAHWAVYLIVEETDAVVSRVQELGGSVLVPAEDSFFGRMALVADPLGASFYVTSQR